LLGSFSFHVTVVKETRKALHERDCAAQEELPSPLTKWPERAMLAPPDGRMLSLSPEQSGGRQHRRGDTPMTEADNAATYRLWFDEGCSRGNVDLADELYSPDYVTHSVGPDLPPTLDGLKLFIRALRQGIPDLECPVEQVVAEGDRVAGRFSLRGTHAGSLFGIPATGKPVDVGVMVIARFNAAGKWVEDWASWDQLGMMQQIGVVPAPAAA
jgi:predicted ester cyclase